MPFNYGDIVYLVTDPDQQERMVTGLLIEDLRIQYQLTRCTQVSYHCAIEIAASRNLKYLFGQN